MIVDSSVKHRLLGQPGARPAAHAQFGPAVSGVKQGSEQGGSMVACGTKIPVTWEAPGMIIMIYYDVLEISTDGKLFILIKT